MYAAASSLSYGISARRPSGDPAVVLDDINLVLRSGEIVGLLGRSGSGKSTLLRIVAGLIRPTAGEVIYCGRVVRQPADGIAMVFQTFALFPWLTVLQNVESGLDALGVSESEARARALFVAEFEDHLSAEDAEHTLSAVIGWGRYAEIFAYDHPRQLFTLDNLK